MTLVRCLGLSVLFASFLLLQPVWLSAQDKKDGPPKKKDPLKILPDEKVEKAPEDIPSHVQLVEAKIRSISGKDMDEFTIAVTSVDPAKVTAFQKWKAEQFSRYDKAKTPKEAYDIEVQYLKDLPAKQKDIYTTKEHNVKAAEKVKVRTIDPPLEYDDRGFIKKWTKKELDVMKGNTRLPGYPAALENLKVSQIAQFYLNPPPKAKKKADEDTPAPKPRPEAVLIVVQPDQPATK